MTGRGDLMPQFTYLQKRKNDAVDFPLPSCILSRFCINLAMEMLCLGGWGLMLSCNTLGRCLADFGCSKLRLRVRFGVAATCQCLQAVLGFTRMQGWQLGTSWAGDFFCSHVEAVKSGRFLFRATGTPCSDIGSRSLAQGPHMVPCIMRLTLAGLNFL